MTQTTASLIPPACALKRRRRVQRAVAADPRVDGTYATREVLCPDGLVRILNEEQPELVQTFADGERPDDTWNALLRYRDSLYLAVLV